MQRLSQIPPPIKGGSFWRDEISKKYFATFIRQCSYVGTISGACPAVCDFGHLKCCGGSRLCDATISAKRVCVRHGPLWPDAAGPSSGVDGPRRLDFKLWLLFVCLNCIFMHFFTAPAASILLGAHLRQRRLFVVLFRSFALCSRLTRNARPGILLCISFFIGQLFHVN